MDQWVSLGSVAGLLGFVLCLGFIVSSIALTPGYDVAGQYLSALGAEPLSLFNIGLMITGALFILFFVALYRYLEGGLYAAVRLGTLLGIVSSLALLFLGLFPLGQVLAHNALAFTFFALGSLSTFLFGIHMFFAKERTYGLGGILVFVIGLLFAIAINPVMQKVTVLAYSLWVLALAVHMMRQ